MSQDFPSPFDDINNNMMQEEPHSKFFEIYVMPT